MFTLEYKPRDGKISVDVLRKEGLVPAVFYGKKQASTSVAVPMADFMKVWKDAGESSVVSLKGTQGVFDTLIHDVTKHPVGNYPLHIDFYVFEKGKKVEVSIPLEWSGVSPAVKDLGGNLIKVLHEIKVKADPSNMPHNIVIDISALKTFDDKVLASDIKLPSGVELAEDASEVILAVEPPKGEEKDEPSTPVDLSAIEVVKKGKKEEEEVPAE
jgi:large subunit ribosomal protein L25